MEERIMLLAWEKTVGGEAFAELSLPDYEPEIRRLLRASVRLSPAECNAENGRVAAEGEAVFEALCLGADGRLFCASVKQPYEISEALKPSERAEGETVLFCDLQPESLVSKALAPRKLSFRCKIKGRIRAFGEVRLDDGAGEGSDLCRLLGKAAGSSLMAPAFFETRLEGTADAGGSDVTALRAFSCRASALVEGCEPYRGYANVKGTAFVEISAVNEDSGELVKLVERVPFSERVDARGVTPDHRCLATAVCGAAECGVTDGGVTYAAELKLELRPELEVEAEYTKDLFSTETLTETVNERKELPRFGAPFSGNITVGLHESAESLELPEKCALEDATAFAVVKNIENSGEKLYAVGETDFNLLLNCGGEYATKDLKVQFRYELEEGAEHFSFGEIGVIALPVRAKLENGRLSLDCELHLQGRICEKSQLDAVCSTSFGDEVEKEKFIKICFPSPTDTPWSVSKRYHIPTDELVSKNQDSLSDDGTFVSAIII